MKNDRLNVLCFYICIYIFLLNIAFVLQKNDYKIKQKHSSINIDFKKSTNAFLFFLHVRYFL